MMMITIMILIGNFKLCEKSFMRKMGKVRLFSHFFLSFFWRIWMLKMIKMMIMIAMCKTSSYLSQQIGHIRRIMMMIIAMCKTSSYLSQQRGRCEQVPFAASSEIVSQILSSGQKSIDMILKSSAFY